MKHIMSGRTGLTGSEHGGAEHCRVSARGGCPDRSVLIRGKDKGIIEIIKIDSIFEERYGKF